MISALTSIGITPRSFAVRHRYAGGELAIFALLGRIEPAVSALRRHAFAGLGIEAERGRTFFIRASRGIRAFAVPQIAVRGLARACGARFGALRVAFFAFRIYLSISAARGDAGAFAKFAGSAAKPE